MEGWIFSESMTGMVLSRALTLQDLTIFGIVSIMGSGGFNLIGTAVKSGGRWWILAFAIAAVLLLGASHTYSRAMVHTKPGNTLESDIVGNMFGRWAELATSTGILVFNIVGISVILVMCSHILFPNGKWLGQITFALATLTGMTILGLQGIDTNRDGINLAGIAFVMMIAFTAALGYISQFIHTKRESVHQPFNKDTFKVSVFTFFFILAGFDILAKFMDEAKDPSDIPISFFASNIVSGIITLGIAMAIVSWIPNLTKANEEEAFENLIGHFLGKNAEDGFTYIVAGFLITTTFVVFLAISRYLYGLGKKNNLQFLMSLNGKNAPYAASGVIAGLIALCILINNTDTLVMISDFGLIVTILLVSAAATFADWKVGESISALLSGITTAGFGGILSLYVLG